MPVLPSVDIRDSDMERGSETSKGYRMVTFVEGDPENPKNWPKAYKWYCTMVVAVTCFVVAFASSVITADIEGVAVEFATSTEAALVSISVFVVGFGVGKFNTVFPSDWRSFSPAYLHGKYAYVHDFRRFMGSLWTALLAFIGLACCAIPFIFWSYGARIRHRSKYAYGGDLELIREGD